MVDDYVAKTISGEDQWTTAIAPVGKYLGLSVNIPDASTATLQRSFDSTNNWKAVDTFSASVEKTIEDPMPGILYRVGVATGDYDSGSPVVELYQRAKN